MGNPHGGLCSLKSSQESLGDDCHFTQWKSLFLPLEILNTGIEQLSLPESDVVDALELTWAVVLQKYSGSDQITIGRVIGDEESIYGAKLDLSDDHLAVLPEPPSLEFFITSRRNSAREQCSLGALKDGAGLDSAIWVTDSRPDIKKSSLLFSSSFDCFIEFQRNTLAEAPLGTFWYRCSGITNPEAQNIASTLKQCMRCFSSSYRNDIRELDLLSPENRKDIQRWLLTRASQRETPTSLPEILQAKAQMQGNSRAIDAWDGSWTYYELEKVSHSLAIHLHAIGVQYGDPVLLRREKSKWTVAAMLATLMVGGICVPIDIRQPKERVRQIFESTGAQFLLTSQAMSQKDSAWTSTTSIQEIIVPFDLDLSSQSRPEKIPEISPETVSFIFFTSGSTGEPKGVVQEHGAVALTTMEISKSMKMDPSTRTFQYSSYSFDVSVGDTFATFFAGGCLCVPSEEQRLNKLAETLNAMKATHVCITSTTLEKLASTDLPYLRQVTVGGEPLTQEQLREWHPRIASIYGTTESVIWDTYHADLSINGPPTNIGCGMGPTTTWIIDPRNPGRLVPIGAIGELLIGGPLLSRGYLNDEEKTKAVFLEKLPWQQEFLTDEPSGRLYRTGDLVRYNPDGTIQYLGRKDRQIKINGQRVELGDIEYALRQSLPDKTICAAEMIRPEFRQGQELLAAFISIPLSERGSTNLCLTSIQDQMASLLPLYMVPSLFIPLEGEMPTTPTGKIDRTRLRQIGSTISPSQTMQYSEDKRIRRYPRTQKEQAVQRICSEALGFTDLSYVDMNHNFFQIGGTSIHAIQFVSLARRDGFSVSVMDIFENPRLFDLAEVLQPPNNWKNGRPNGEMLVEPFSLLPPGVDQEEIKRVSAASCRVPISQIQDVLPCTALQAGLLALSSKTPGAYIQQAVMELPSNVDQQKFKEAYEKAAHRIPIIRCRAFALPQANHHIHLAVCDRVEEWSIYKDLDHCIDQDCKQLSYSALGGQLTKCSLVSDSTEKLYFVWTIHHALFDGWSFSLMLDEIERQFFGDETSTLRPFQNFVHYLQNRVDHSACRTFWKSFLQDSTKLEFPVSLPSGYHTSGNISTISRTVAGLEWPATGITPSTVLQGAWAVLLSQHTTSSDITFGLTTSGRYAALPGIENIGGPTITTVPFRVSVDASQSVSKYLQQLQLDVVSIVPYEQMGLAEIAKLNPGAEKACGFQTLLVIQPPEESETRLFNRRQANTFGTLSTYAVTLQCCLNGSGSVNFHMEIDESVLDQLEAERLLSQLAVILRRLCMPSMEERKISTIMSCSDADMNQIFDWNKGTLATRPETVLEMIARQVDSNPDGLAIDAWDGRLTYRELDVRVHQLVQLLSLHLEDSAMSPSVMVCLEKSHLAVVAFIAVIKAGGVCVLVDPTYPDERVKTIIQRSEACLALTTECQSDRLRPWIRTISMSKNPSFPSDATISDRYYKPMPTDNACIVFTSGSTGTPKAISWSHETLAKTASELGSKFELSSRSRVFQFSSYAFDVSIHETMATLVHGGCICVPSEEARRNELQEAIMSFKPTSIILTPSTAKVLTPSSLQSLQTVVFCGEPLPAHVAEAWSSRMAVYNWYGPAECSLATCCRIGPSWRAGNIGVGGSTKTWIVNPQDHDKLQPIGAVGELLLQGPCVASKYVQDELRTTQSFISPPQWLLQGLPETMGAKLYKTGDLARYASDGSIILLGRKDTQVKVRGQRVELGEVEVVLQRVLGPNAAVVVDQINVQGGRESSTLAAFVDVPGLEHSENIVSADWTHTTQERLKETLPDWMIPSIFFSVQELPQTATGKVDRRKLKDLGAEWSANFFTTSNASMNGGTWSPSTKNEAVLSQLWVEVLGISADQLSNTAHFIRQGGNSIDAMRLAAAAKEMGFLLSVRDILRTPCLADLSKQMQNIIPDQSSHTQPLFPPFCLVEKDIKADDARQITAFQCKVSPGLVEDVFPCTALQTAFLALTCKNPCDYVSRSVFQIHGNADLFQSCWKTVIEATPILRTRIVDVGGDDLYQAIIHESVEFNNEHSSVDEYLHHDEQLTMGLGARLARYGIVPDPNSQYLFTFIWTMHHSLYDAWSFRAILDQVERLYKGKTLAPTIPFQGFVSHTISLKDNPAAGEFWKTKLDGAIAPQFPVLPRPGYQARATRTIEECTASTESPESAGQQAGVTLTTILRAAWSLVLARYSRSNDVVFGTTVLGRQGPVAGAGEMIGPTIGTIPIRIRWSEETTVQDILRTIHQDSIEIMLFEQLGLHKIRRLGAGPESACDFQTMLIVQPANESSHRSGCLFDDFKGDHTIGAFSSTALVLRCSLPSTKVEGIKLYLDFDPCVVDSVQARRILSQMNHTVSQLLTSTPATRISDLQLLSPLDIECILQWNERLIQPANMTVNDVFSDIVQKFPTAPAIHAWDLELSYSELDQYSNSFARKLVSLGLKSQQNVPLYFEKSAWAIVAIIGVIKIGGTVVLLEPGQPDDRLRSIVSRIKAPVIVTSQKNQGSARTLLPSYRVVVVGATTINSNPLPYLPSRPLIDSSHALYLAFTSGSTGSPKGVVITHGNLCTALKQRQSVLPYQPGDRVLDSVSYAFDVCWGNILFTLCSGACLCVPTDIEDIGASINQFSATVVGIVPSVARLLDYRQYPTLRTITFGGESASQTDKEAWEQHVNVFNSYGPSECTVSVALGRLNGENRIHVGRGMGATAWIVDDTMGSNCLASIGGIGELWLEGPQVGKGYLDDPKSSAAAFIETTPTWLAALRTATSIGMAGEKVSLYNGTEGVAEMKSLLLNNRRFYRTGDLAQYYPDGMIRIIGRRDTQVKLRGQRIELEEVEHHVKKLLPQGSEVAAEVITPRSSPTRQFLVMFVVLDAALGLSDHACKCLRQTINSELSQALPSYMRPSAYIPLSGIPRLAAGKVDRNKLREIGAVLSVQDLTRPLHESDSNSMRTPPRSLAEERLQGLWSRCLGLTQEDIGREDSFLQLDGGDSISAMRLVRLAEEHGMLFSIRDVFLYPRLCDLATKVIFGESSEGSVPPFSLWRGDWTVDHLKNEAATRCDVNADQVEDIFPCTAMQEGLLAVTSMEPSMYSCRETFELHEYIDVSRLQRAWDTVAASMPILRTRFIDLHPHGLYQVVLKENIVWGFREAEHPMHLGGRLVYWDLIQKADSRQLVWTIHHSLYDGWSIPRILEQVDRAYYQEPLRPCLPMQHFIQHISTADEEECQNFWKKQLSEAPSSCFPALPNTSYQAKSTESCSIHLPGFGWPTGVDVTPSVWIRAAWTLLIGHVTNTEDVNFGTTVSGRQAPVKGILDIIGPTIATVPVRVQIDWNCSIHDFVRQLQQQATDMIPFEQIGLHRLRRINEDTNQGSRFGTLLNVQLAQDEPYNMRVCTRKGDRPEGQFNNFALIVDCELRKSGLLIQLDFDPNIIHSTQAERLIHQLEAILMQFDGKTLDLTRSLANFNPISSQDLSDLRQWNGIVPKEIPILLDRTINKRVQERPHAMAVDAWDGKLTYRMLDEYSTKLASHLQTEYEQDIGPGIAIPLCFEKSMWTVVAALGVMKTGSAFTLMDASQPEQRLRTITSQVNSNLVICSTSNRDLAARLAKCVIVVDHSAMLHWPLSCLPSRAQPDSPLYIVFTSGSTGTPKGAIITHSNFSSAVEHQGPFLGYNSETRVYDFASYSFDVALSNLLHCLAAGGCMCIPSDAERKHGKLAESMERMKVNVVDLTPSVARTLDPTAVPSLKTLVLGGEAALRSDIALWAPYVRVLNGIGQAECTVTTTMATMDPNVPGTPGIGKAMGTITWIVNPTDHHQLAPIGAVGELLVEGPLVGAGYWNDEIKTAASFIEPPRWLASTTGLRGRHRNGRLYKTGDLVRYDAEGGLHFLGRKDAQAKIRGQRIELEEVEYHVQRLLLSLSMNTSVAAEAVVLSGASMRNAALVVFICPADFDKGDSDSFNTLDPTSFPHDRRKELDTLLQNELPSAMVPFVYIPVNQIPLSPTGKTDRKRLKAFGKSLSAEDIAKFRGVESKPKRAPLTPTESQLRDLWAEILETSVENIGIDDNFVELGGDSISAMRLITLAKRRGLRIDSRNFLQTSSTLSGLASTISCLTTSATLEEYHPFSQLKTDQEAAFLDSYVIPHLGISMSDIEDVFPVTEFQAECVKAAYGQKPPSFLNYFYIDLNSPKLDSATISTACRAIVRHFPILRTVFVPYNDQFLQVVTKNWDPELEDICVPCKAVAKASEKLARQDWLDSDLSSGTRLIHFMLIRANDKPGTSRLVIRMSHALYDGISLGPLMEALSAAIEKRELPPTRSFASFVDHSVNIREDSIQYWSSVLSNSVMTKMPTGCLTDDVCMSTPYIIKRTVGLQMPLPKGLTPATFYTACWATVIASVTRQRDVVFGRLVSGRGAALDIATESIVGPCLNVVPLRATWAPDHHLCSPHKVFDAIQQQQLEGMPFESTSLSDIISSCTDWPKNTKYGSVFQYQNIDETPEATVFGASAHFDVIPMEFRPEQLWVLVKPIGEEAEVILFGTTAIMAEEQAQILADQFVKYVTLGGILDGV
ncbi:hypothetical protein DTO271G3_643 [Paecilomyces variotii]|nr:hypothetical protein DTO271G3_643 [Paecilomyces variotii]